MENLIFCSVKYFSWVTQLSNTCSKLEIEALDLLRPDVFIENFENISRIIQHVNQVLLFPTLNMYLFVSNELLKTCSKWTKATYH